jgi:AcrR family transcriptional regulator
MKKSSPAKKPPCMPRADQASVRERILDAAFVAFLTHGYAGASTLEIATRARVSKRELYSYFENKQALLAAGIKERTERMRIPLNFPDITSRAALAATLRHYGVAVMVGLSEPHVLAVHRLAIAEAARSPELAATLDKEGREANRRGLTELLAKAQALGLVDDDNPEDMAAQFSALLWLDLFPKLLLRVSERPSPKEIEHRAQSATDLFLKLHPANKA